MVRSGKGKTMAKIINCGLAWEQEEIDAIMARAIEKQIKAGSERIISESAQTSDGEPNLAIAQLLLSAAVLAQTIGMKPKDCEYGVTLAMSETFYRPKSKH